MKEILMKGSTVGRLNSPWERVLHLASRRAFRKGQTIDIGAGMKEDGRPCFYYILSGRIRLSYVGRGGEERTILYAGPGSLMNVPSVVADDVKNTVVTCMEAAEVALFDAGDPDGYAALRRNIPI